MQELTHLYNCCIQTGNFQFIWGFTEISPVSKMSDLGKVKNWRPISQVKLPGKLYLTEYYMHNFQNLSINCYIEINRVFVQI